jgi:Kef-type K+ transport system membrane component KefB
MQVLLSDMALIIIFGSLLALVAKFLRQPLLLGYILAGLIIGPFGLNHIGEQETILTISELGITFLLFLVGIELNINKIKEVGSTVLIGGLLQVFITGIVASLLTLLFGMSLVVSFYLGLAIAFSSTLIGIKYLSEKKEMDTLHGRIVVGILILQDIIAILVISILPTISSFNPTKIIFALVNGIALIGFAFLISKFILPRLFSFASKNGELLFLTSLAVCFLFASLAQVMGFSLTIGAFLAGIMIASVPYSLDIISRVKSLTTFFNALFFVALGMQIVPSTIPAILPLVIGYVLFAIIIKVLIVYAILRKYGYEKKTAFISGLSLGQVSEFSLIIISQGILLNHLTPNILSLVILLTITTMAISTYLLGNDAAVFQRYQKILSFIDSKIKPKEESHDDHKEDLMDAEIIVNTHDKLSSAFVESLKEKKVVLIGSHITKRFKSLYGSLSEHEFLEKFDLSSLKLVISLSNDKFENKMIIKNISNNSTAILVVCASMVEDALELYEAGADYVVIPNIESEKKLISFLGIAKDDSKHVLDKIWHIENLRKTIRS